MAEAKRDYYEVLGVSKDVDEATLKKASFRLYKEGMELLNECSQKIDRVEKKMLQMNEDGTFREF